MIHSIDHKNRITIRCDECPATFYSGEIKLSEANHAAEKEGWETAIDSHWCPLCWEKHLVKRGLKGGE